MIDNAASTEPATSATAERWALLVRPEPGEREAPFEVRIRRWIKCGLRGFGIRLVEATATTLPEQLASAREEIVRLRLELEKAKRPKRERIIA